MTANSNDEQRNPFTTTSSRMIYSNPWIEVVEDKIILPNGNTSIYGKVLFKKLSVGVIPLSSENDTWLVGQYRYPIRKYSWEIPMGGGPLDVSPLETAKREFKEETGITAHRWTHLLNVHTSNSVTDEMGIVYVATELLIEKPALDETEVITVRRLPFREAVNMAMTNQITEAISMSALLFLARQLDTQGDFIKKGPDF